MSDEVHSPYGKLSYGSYLHVPEMLQLQEPKSENEAHDELLFIIIHQAYELWFKQILFELDQTARCIDRDDTFEATRLLRRVHRIESLLIHQIHILETMTPRDFLSFRKVLNPASGFQSVQFREVEFVTGMKNPRVLKSMTCTDEEKARLDRRLTEPSLRDRFYRLLRRKGFEVEIPADDAPDDDPSSQRTLEEMSRLFKYPEDYFDLYTLSEALVEHDQNLLLWRYHHVRVVERLIGAKMGTGGSSGVRYLESTLTKRAYPVLWSARGLLDDEEFYGTSRGPTRV